MIFPIGINFIRHFAALDLWHLGRKFHKDVGNPYICTCLPVNYGCCGHVTPVNYRHSDHVTPRKLRMPWSCVSL